VPDPTVYLLLAPPTLLPSFATPYFAKQIWLQALLSKYLQVLSSRSIFACLAALALAVPSLVAPALATTTHNTLARGEYLLQPLPVYAHSFKPTKFYSSPFETAKPMPSAPPFPAPTLLSRCIPSLLAMPAADADCFLSARIILTPFVLQVLHAHPLVLWKCLRQAIILRDTSLDGGVDDICILSYRIS